MTKSECNECRSANDESNAVIPSEVENGAAGEAATWTGRPEVERTGSERIKSRGIRLGQRNGILRFRFASLRMTVLRHSSLIRLARRY